MSPRLLALPVSLLLFLQSPAQEASNASQPDSTRSLDAVVVEANAAPVYTANEAPTLLKLPVPLSVTPQTVTVVPKEVIRDQAAQTLSDVFRNISGVFESGNTLNAQAEVLPYIRGFETPVVFRNGMRATQVGSIDLFNIESVEVIKGPASILFGGMEVGGALNYTTKRPQATPFNEIIQQFGSYHHYRTTLDSTGPLDSAGRVLYRFNAAYTNSESFRDFMEIEREAIAPSLLWRISDDTEIGLEVSYIRDRQPYDTGVPVGFKGERLVSDDTFFNNPALDGRKLEDVFAGLTFDHRFNDHIRLRSRLQYHAANPTNEAIRPTVVIGAPGAEVLRQRYQNEERHDDEWQWVSDLIFQFETGGIEHNALIGFDLIRQDSEFARFRRNGPNVPIRGFPSGSYNFDPRPNRRVTTDLSDLEWAAVYFQDQMSMFDDRLHLLLGGRFDYVMQDQMLPNQVSKTDREFSGRAGLLYEATEWASPYISVSQSFRPHAFFPIDRNGQVLDPETGIQYEAGVKFDFFEERLLATLSAYQIHKKDVPVFDTPYFNATGNSANLPGVDQSSQGVEFDVSGRITENLSLIANYAYTDTETTRSELTPGDVGTRLGNVPLNALRVWLAYNFPKGCALEGLGVGAGARYESERLAAFGTTELDEFLVFDAGAWYRRELEGGRVLKAQVNIRNLTDLEYYSRASTQAIVHPGAPLGVFLSVGLEF